MTHFTSLALLTFLLAGQQGPADKATTDREHFQGTWVVVSVIADGEALPPEKIKDMQVQFKDDHFIATGREQTYDGAFTIQADGTPHKIDATFKARGTKEERTAKGIYELDGNKLKVCWREKDGPRPAELRSTPLSGNFLMVLQRSKD